MESKVCIISLKIDSTEWRMQSGKGKDYCRRGRRNRAERNMSHVSKEIPPICPFLPHWSSSVIHLTLVDQKATFENSLSSICN